MADLPVPMALALGCPIIQSPTSRLAGGQHRGATTASWVRGTVQPMRDVLQSIGCATVDRIKLSRSLVRAVVHAGERPPPASRRRRRRRKLAQV